MRYLLIILPLFFISCISKKGIFYKKPYCEENYGLYGTYYKECENYIFKFKTKKRKICLECN